MSFDMLVKGVMGYGETAKEIAVQEDRPRENGGRSPSPSRARTSPGRDAAALLPAAPTHHDRPWTLPRSPGAAVTAPAPAEGRARNAKTLVVVPVGGGVPVARARPEVLGIVVPGAAANHTTAGGRSGPRDRLPARREPPVPEDRAAQPPRVGMRRVRHPGANSLLHFPSCDGARPPAVAEPAQAVAEAPHVRRRQPTTPARPQLEPEAGRCRP